MDLKLHTDILFDQDNNLTAENLPAEFDGCEFRKMNWAQWNLSKTVFMDCVFNECNLSGAKLTKTAFKNVRFINCKMTGMSFDQADPFLFEVYFEDSHLELSNFYKCSLKKTVFLRSVLKEVDFTEANLSDAVFDQCDLEKAIFDQTRLEKTDLRSALDYSIDPKKNHIKKLKCSYPGLLGLLDTVDIVID